MDCYKNANTNHTPQTIYTAVFLADYCKRTLTDWWAKHASRCSRMCTRAT